MLDFIKSLNVDWLYDILISIGIVFAAFIVSKIAKIVEKGLHKRVITRTQSDLDDKILEFGRSAVQRIIWLLCLYLISIQLGELLGTRLSGYVGGAIYVLIVLIIAHFISKVIHLALDAYSARLGKLVAGRIKEEFAPLLRKIVSMVIYIIALVQIFHHFGQDINSIVVSLGVGSLAVALAAKDTIANMIAGFTIMTDRPFRIGDRILLESGEKGDVFDIGIRTTKILTFDNTLIIVPNQQIVNDKVINLTYPDPRIRIKIEVGVAYGTDLDKAKKILVDICKTHPEVLEQPEPASYFTNFGESSLDLMVVCRVAEWGDQWRVGEEIRMEIKKTFEREGIQIPFPQRDVHMRKE